VFTADSFLDKISSCPNVDKDSSRPQDAAAPRGSRQDSWRKDGASFSFRLADSCKYVCTRQKLLSTSPLHLQLYGSQLTETYVQTRLPTFVLTSPFLSSIIVLDKSCAGLTFRLSMEQYHSKLQLAPRPSNCYPFGRPNPPVENAPEGGSRDAEPPRRRSFCMFRDADGCEECAGRPHNAGIVIVSESQRALLQRTKKETLTCCGLQHDCKT
jgi:hypothetical protein